MRIFAISGQDELYQGLHGMRHVNVIIANAIEEAIEEARNLAYEVMTEYSQIYEQLEEDVCEYCDSEGVRYGWETVEEENLREEVYENDAVYEVYELNIEKLPTLNLSELSRYFYESPEEFLNAFSLGE